MTTILMEKQDGIAYITLNQPNRLNSFSYTMLKELEETLDDIQFSNDVGVLIFTGAGDRAFSAGADLKERKTLNEWQVRRNVATTGAVFNKIAKLPIPTIAAINGYALGGGFELALACDFMIASDNAVIGLPETKMAIIPGAGGTQRLARLVGEMKAKELIFTAKKLSAREALDLNIVLDVAPKDKLIDEAKKLADAILPNGPIAIKQAKYAISEGLNTDLQTGIEIEKKAYEVTIPTEDRIEALEAFSDKRAPIFKGK